MQKKWIAVSGLAGALALGSWSVGARALAQAVDSPQGPPPQMQDRPDRPDGPDGPRPLGRLMRAEMGRWMTLTAELDLTPDQHRQIHQILESHRDEILAVVKPLIEKHRALRDAVTAANPDEQAIRAASDGMGHAIGDAAVLVSKIKTQVAGVLTDKQREKISEFRSQTDQAVDEFLTEVSTGGQGQPGGQ